MSIFIAEQNNLVAWSTNIPSAYLETFTNQNIWILVGPEFSSPKRQLLIIIKAFYGLRSSGARWHDRLADILREEKFASCCAEPDIWMHANGELYKYIAVYADDLKFAMRQP